MSIEAISDIVKGGVSAFPSGAYAPLASPAFTGTPTAPTQALTDYTDKLATTKFVSDFSYNQFLTDLRVEFAPLTSPALIGTPTAPTATAGTNTTQLATTAFVSTAINNIGKVPTGGTTGQVLTKSSNSDFATGWTTLVAYAPLASPAFSGTPTAPTATAGTNTTQLATTAFVATAVAAGGGGGGSGGMTLLSTTTLTGYTTSITNIPQTYKGLKIIVLEAKTANGSTSDFSLAVSANGSDYVTTSALTGATGTINNTKEVSSIIDMPNYTSGFSIFSMMSVINTSSPSFNTSYNTGGQVGGIYTYSVKLTGGIAHLRFLCGNQFSGGTVLVYGVN